jgi:hypothetical protein
MAELFERVVGGVHGGWVSVGAVCGCTAPQLGCRARKPLERTSSAIRGESMQTYSIPTYPTNGAVIRTILPTIRSGGVSNEGEEPFGFGLFVCRSEFVCVGSFWWMKKKSTHAPSPPLTRFLKFCGMDSAGARSQSTQWVCGHSLTALHAGARHSFGPRRTTVCRQDPLGAAT